jgi:hypothetical protein
VTIFDLDAEVSKGRAKNIFRDNRGDGRIVPPSPRHVLMSKQSLLRMHGLRPPRAVTSPEMSCYRRG